MKLKKLRKKNDQYLKSSEKMTKISENRLFFEKNVKNRFFLFARFKIKLLDSSAQTDPSNRLLPY